MLIDLTPSQDSTAVSYTLRSLPDKNRK